MLTELLPSWVASAGTAGPHPDSKALVFPEEERLIARAALGGRQAFTAGRLCAREALDRLGLPAAPLLGTGGRAPSWPDGVVGSITHCAGFAGAIAAHRRDAAALGVDAEPDQPLPAGLLEVVTVGAEAVRLAAHRERRGDLCWDRLLFSAKEAVYKAWSGAGGGRLGLEDIEIDFSRRGAASAGGFRAHITPCRPHSTLPHLMHGRWLARDGLLLTAVVAPAPPTPTPPDAATSDQEPAAHA